MIKDTAYNLEIRLQQIDEKMTQYAIENAKTPDANINLKDEKAVTEQCLHICTNAKSYIESLLNQESSLLQEDPQNAFNAQILTRQSLGDNQNNLIETINHLNERLRSLIVNENPQDGNERKRLLDDIDISKQCLEVCKMGSEFSNQKIYKIGEVIADGNCDQVVVNSLADIFDVQKALSRGKSAQLVASVPPESLQHLVEQRYSSHFGPFVDDSSPLQGDSEIQNNNQVFSSQTVNDGQSFVPERNRIKPSPNEMRKRADGPVNGTANQG